MRKVIRTSLVAVLVVLMAVFSVVPAFAASNTLLDSSKKVSFTAECNKPGYTFKVYKVASLDSNSKSPYETKYTSLISSVSNTDITKAIKDGNSVKLLALLDKANLAGAKECGTFGPTSATVTSKTFSNLEQGVYYVKAVNFPAGVKWVRNSVFALPFYPDNETGWDYTIDTIPLATKVEDKDITTKKEITNSTKGNVNFTDVSLGDTVNFKIDSTVTGDASHTITTPEGDEYVTEDMKLNSYFITDIMSKGLTLDKNSFKMYLLREDGSTIKTLSNAGTDPDFIVTYEIGFDGTDLTKETKFSVALTKSYLQKDEFYEDDVYYTRITYSAVLNKNAVVGTAGNPNTEGKISYSNKNDVVQEHQGNTVYVYTYAITSNKTDTSDRPLAGAEFKLFKTESDAKALENAIATGISDGNGKVVYKNAKNEEIRLQSGTYYAVETKAPEGYNPYGKVIKIDATATYNDTLTNGTYVKTCPQNGTATFTVPNSKIIVPKTGGIGDNMFYIGAGACAVVILGLSVLGVIVSKKKRRNATK